MFIYLAKFERRPGLLKIGMAKDVSARMSQLSRHHGKPTALQEFHVGDGNHHFEKFLHQRFSDKRQELEKCDGYTEFFSESVENDAKILLVAVAGQPSSPVKKPQRNRKYHWEKAVKAVVASVEREMYAAYSAQDRELCRCIHFVSRVGQAGGGKLGSKEHIDDETKSWRISTLFNTSDTLPLHDVACALDLGIDENTVINCAVSKVRERGSNRLTPWRLRVLLKMNRHPRSDRYQELEKAHKKLQDRYNAVAAIAAMAKELMQVPEVNEVEEMAPVVRGLRQYGEHLFKDSDVYGAVTYLKFELYNK